MPVKRKSSELTGGTGDVNPQTYVLTAPFHIMNAVAGPPAGNSSMTGLQFPLPVPKYPGNNDRAIVAEVLGVQWEILDILTPTAPPSTATIDFWLSTALAPVQSPVPLPPGATIAQAELLALQDPGAISRIRRSVGLSVLVVGAGADSSTPVLYDFPLSEYDDLTDQAGHGILVATDNVALNTFISINSNESYSTNGCVATIFYRMKEISLIEYIGIVQSQQRGIGGR